MTFNVSGTVTHADKSPAEGLVVRAYDRDLRNEEKLGKEVYTDKQGRYDIPYSSGDFTRADKETADLVVRVYKIKGATELAASDIVFNAASKQVIDLQLPVDAGEVSLWESLTQTVSPLLTNQGKNGESLLPRELDDNDLDFIVKECGPDRDHVRFWALADKFAHEYKLIHLQPLGLARQRMSSGKTVAAVNHDFGGEDAAEVLERICFFGWFLNDQPQKFDSLVRRPADALLASLDRAVAQNHIPQLDDKAKAVVSHALKSRRMVEEIKPARDGEHPWPTHKPPR
jgi:hypothetical protein